MYETTPFSKQYSYPYELFQFHYHCGFPYNGYDRVMFTRPSGLVSLNAGVAHEGRLSQWLKKPSSTKESGEAQSETDGLAVGTTRVSATSRFAINDLEFPVEQSNSGQTSTFYLSPLDLQAAANVLHQLSRRVQVGVELKNNRFLTAQINNQDNRRVSASLHFQMSAKSAFLIKWKNMSQTFRSDPLPTPASGKPPQPPRLNYIDVGYYRRCAPHSPTVAPWIYSMAGAEMRIMPSCSSLKLAFDVGFQKSLAQKWMAKVKLNHLGDCAMALVWQATPSMVFSMSILTKPFHKVNELYGLGFGVSFEYPHVERKNGVYFANNY